MNEPFGESGAQTEEARSYWSLFYQAVELANRGSGPGALEILRRLRDAPEKPRVDANGNADYTYATILQSFPESQASITESIAILEALQKDLEKGTKRLDSVLLLNEQAAGYLTLGQPERALKLANAALEAASGTDPGLSLVLQNIARSHFELNDSDEARRTYLHMLDVSLQRNHLAHAGIAAEWLGRIALAAGSLADARAWCSLSSRAYRVAAPRHLVSSDDLRWSCASVPASIPTPPASLDPLAGALDQRLPPADEIGPRAGAHLDELSLDLGALYMLADEEAGVETWIRFSVYVEEPDIRRLASALIAEAQTILPHDYKWEVLTSLLTELWPDRAELILKHLSAGSANVKWELQQRPGEGPTLEWSERGALPLMYGSEFVALGTLFQAAYLSRKKSFAQFGPSVHLFNIQDRAWPRPLHFWMITQGQATAGGARGPAHLAEEITRPRLSDALQNVAAFMDLDYSEAEAESLDKSGFVALKLTEITALEGRPPEDIGTLPLNEYNVANLPDQSVAALSETRPGLVVDRYYNTLFFAPAPETARRASYGTNTELFRDHFTDFRKNLRIIGSLRTKHYSVPVAEVRDAAELAGIAAALEARGKELEASKHASNGGRIWYRGQVRGFLLGRGTLASEYLYGVAGVTEPSLPGAAPRRGWNYHEMHSFLSVMLQAHIYRISRERGEKVQETHGRWRNFFLDPGKWDLGVMLLAQHYGVPTHGIDITHDLDVAVWFATNRYVSSGGRAHYRKLHADDFGRDPGNWPVLYMILPVTNSLRGAIRDVDLLEPFAIDAARPRQQSAAFFMGAHGLHKNRLAEAVVCVLRLNPGIWVTRSSYESLFPDVDADPIYRWMLDLKQRYTQGAIGRFLNEVPHYEFGRPAAVA